MDRNTEYLSDIYRGVRMGAETLDSVIKRTDAKLIKQELIREKYTYREFENKLMNENRSRHQRPKPISKTKKRMAKMGIAMNTALDNSPSHIADLVIQGNNMGIIGMNKAKNHHRLCDKRITGLANELITIQKQNIDNLTRFL